MTSVESRHTAPIVTITAAAHALAEPGGVPALLERVVALAVATVGCDGAAITLTPGETPVISVATSDGATTARSLLELPLSVAHADGTTDGALTFYADAVDAFGHNERLLAEAYAAVATLAVSAALAHLKAGVHEEQLREAIESRDVIGQAKGILMAREKCTADEAFEILRRASQRENVKLRDIAARVAQHVT